MRVYDEHGTEIPAAPFADLLADPGAVATELDYLREFSRTTTTYLRTLDAHADCAGRAECPEVIDRLREVVGLAHADTPEPDDACAECGTRTRPPAGWHCLSFRQAGVVEFRQFCSVTCLASWACECLAPDGAPF